jgi:signal recognition particle subunit SRP54
MFEGLGNKFGSIFDRLRGRGVLSEADVDTAMREIRVALLEADVALPVVKDFIAKVREGALGAEVLRSVTPGQQVVKIVHDELVKMLGEDTAEVSLNAAAPVVILMAGLQGSGKTTSAGKLAKRLIEKQRKKVLLASLDTRRPAAQEQLAILATQVGAASLPIITGQAPIEITKRALEAARLGAYDVLILDTAGRLAIDEELMAEMAAVRDVARPHETLLVADAMTGQDAVNVARIFHERIGITGLVLTRLDGDARGGALLSMRAVTGCPVKLIGVGEKMDALEPVHPSRMADRILGMGDVVSLVEKAAESLDAAEAERMAEKMMKGVFTLDDMLGQLRQIKKMGGMKGIMGFLPGVAKMKDQLAKANVDEGIIGKQEAIILSMTKLERRTPDLIKARRKQRIAAGAGVDVAAVNKLLKQYEQMRDMMKRVQKMGGMKGLLGGGGLPPGMVPPGGGFPFK